MVLAACFNNELCETFDCLLLRMPVVTETVQQRIGVVLPNRILSRSQIGSAKGDKVTAIQHDAATGQCSVNASEHI